jgi:hypothetical protein
MLIAALLKDPITAAKSTLWFVGPFMEKLNSKALKVYEKWGADPQANLQIPDVNLKTLAL